MRAGAGDALQPGTTIPPAFSHLMRVRAGSRYLQLPALSRQRVDALVPQLGRRGGGSHSGADAQAVFHRLFGLLETVSRAARISRS
jgi:hypothetical protein